MIRPVSVAVLFLVLTESSGFSDMATNVVYTNYNAPIQVFSWNGTTIPLNHTHMFCLAELLIFTCANYRYEEFTPLTTGERLVLQATSDGNCIFNAVSIALTGNEKLAMMLRLLSVVAMADQLVELSKYLHEEYQNVASVWCESSTQATPEAIEKYLRDQLVFIVKNPYTDGSILHLLLLCHLLSHPIQQHCASNHHSEHRQLLHPPLTFSTLQQYTQCGYQQGQRIDMQLSTMWCQQYASLDCIAQIKI